MKDYILFAIISVILFLVVAIPVSLPKQIAAENPIEIISANLSKADVRPGDVLTVTVEAKSESGVKEIVADMGGIENVSLQNIAGSIYQGIWQKDWIVHSTEEKNYTVTLFVRDTVGNQLIDKSLSFIDPNTIGTSTSQWATYSSDQKKSFYAQGLFWIFYYNGSRMVYQTSADGTTWSSVTDVRAVASGQEFSVYYDSANNFVHYAYGNTATGNWAMKYRRGQPLSNGTINWTTAEQNAAPADATMAYDWPVIKVDSSGYPWIAWRHENATAYSARVTKSNLNNGTWNTSSGFPYILEGGSTTTSRAAYPVPLSSSNMYVIYGQDDQVAKGKLWTGSWGSEESIGSNVTLRIYLSDAVADSSDNIFYLFQENSVNGDIRSVKRTNSTGTWGSEVGIAVNTQASPTSPCLSIDTLTNDLYAFWAGSPTNNHIYYKKYTASTSTWNSSATDWITETALTGLDRLTSFYQVNNGTIGLVHMNRTASPYQVRFTYFIVPTPPQWSSNTTSIVSTYSATNSQFNITWTDNVAVSKVFFESNFSGSPVNYTMTQTATNVYNYNNTLPAGNFYWRSFANDTSDNWNVSYQWNFTVAKANPVLILNNNTAAVNTSGLVGYWRFENESLGFATDYSGWNNTGTLTNMNNAGNATSGPTAGRFGKGMQFDWDNDYINIADSNNWYFGSRNFTVDFWAKFNDLPAPGFQFTIFVQGDDGSNYQKLALLNNAGAYRLQYYVITGGGNVININLSTSPSVTTGTWYHFALVRNGNNWYGFQDGNQLGTQSNSNSVGDYSGEFDIGGNNYPYNFYGLLDEFHIWNRSLTADEIKELYESNVVYGTQTNFTFSEQNTGDADVNYDFFRNGTVAGVWHFDESSGNITVDSSGNGNSGTLTNMNTTGNATSGWNSTDCKYGSCLQFDGVNDYAYISDSDNWYFGSGDFAIDFWVKFNSLPNNDNYQQIFGQYVSSSNRDDLFLYNNAGTYQWGWNVVSDGSTIISIVKNSPGLSTGTWYHVALVRSGTSWSWFQDGAQCGTTDTDSDSVPDFASVICLGAKDCWQLYFNGLLDEFRIYKGRALSSAEILCHYGNNCSAAGFNNETNTLGAGYHYYSAYTAGGQNYTASALLLPLNVSKGSTTNHLALNGTEGNATYAYGVNNTINATGWNSANEGSFILYRNGTALATINGTNFVTNISSNLAIGDYNYTLTFSDSNFTDTAAVTYFAFVRDLFAPQWQNQETNDTDNSILQGQGINLTAQGKDETALDWAWLATNESGSWKNYTTSGMWTQTSTADFNNGTFVNTTVSNGNVILSNTTDINASTVLLLHMNGVDASTTFLDSSFGNKSVTPYGNAQIDTAQSKFGGASGLFDGTGDYLSTPDSADWDFGTGDFTIDFFIYISQNQGVADSVGIISTGKTTESGPWCILFGKYADYPNKIRVARLAVASDITSSTSVSLNTWTHVALVRYGNTLTLYQNGSSVGTFGASGISYNGGSGGLVIGRFYTDESNYYISGWLDEYRVSKGIARWTSNFTPPTYEYEYYPSGSYESQVFDAGSTQLWQTLSWNETLSSGTDICGQVAVNNTGSWIYSGLSCTPPYSLSVSNSRFIKANFTLNTTNTTGTPTLHDFNITYNNYNSPMNMNNAVNTWTWSNFTWSNSSVADDTLVSWKIFYNDTGGNENVTDVMNFSVSSPPQITILSPLNQSYATSSVWANVSLNKIGSKCLAELDSTTNYTMSNTTGNWNYLLSLATGAHNVKFYCNTTVNVFNTSAVRYFSVDATAPQWQNQGTNDTNNQINSGEAINLTAQGKDETALDWAWLATNESGSWKNYTQLNWWNSSWLYRKNITINNSQNSNTLTNYQVFVNVSYDSDMNTTFKDLRFTYYNSTSQTETEIPYWIEKNISSSYAETWVNVTRIPASSYQTIYMYYGNPSASSASNVNNTFVFFDNFVDNTIDTAKWNTHVGNGGVVSESGGEHVHTGDSNWWGANSYTNVSIPFGNYTIKFKARHPTHYGTAPTAQILLVDKNTVTWGDTYYDSPTNNAVALLDNFNGDAAFTSCEIRVMIFGINTTHVTYNSTVLSGTCSNGNVAQTTKAITGTIGANNLSIDFSTAEYQNNPTYWDNINITKYTSPEPTYSTGTEETYTTGGRTYNSPMNMTKDSNWQWSNFTWSNSSVADDTTVSWKIFYNDTSGNENGTNTMNFAVSRPPLISILSPLNQSYGSASVWANISLNKNGNWCGAELDLTTNYTMSNTTGNWNYLLSLATGAHNVKFYCNSSLNVMNTSDTRYFSVDVTAPIWQNQGTNDTDNSILQGQAINLTAQGKDETALDWAWLATNESGSWRNYTQTATQTISDSFTDNSKIAIKTNLTVNTTLGQVKLTGVPVDASTVGLWRLDDGSGTSATDSSQYNNGGTIYGSPQWLSGTNCKSGSCLNFSGVNNQDYISVAASASLNLTQFTVSAWVNTRNNIGPVEILRKQSGSYTNYYLLIENSKFEVCFTSSTNWYCTSGTTTPVVGQWYYVVGTFDSSNYSRIYVNGTQEGSTTGYNYVPDMNTGTLTIGGNPTTSRSWNGTIDEVRVLNRAFTSTEVQTEYIAGVGKYYPSGQLWSTNLLSGLSVASIDSFGYNISSIPTNTGLKVQFSQDNSTWYNSTGSLNGWNNLSAGSNTISLSSLGWSGANFYYKIQFISNETDTPILDDVNVTYTQSTYNSPMNMTKDSNWQWSNFTWSNSSVAEGAVVGWRIYYNDTSGNENVTDIMNFTIRETTPPQWSSNATSIVSTYSSTASQFNITWTDNFAVDKVFIEGNWSGSSYNYTPSVDGNVRYLSVILPAGDFYWRSFANDTSNNWNVSHQWNFTVNKTQPVLILNNNTATVNTSGLVGYWRFEEGQCVTPDTELILENGTRTRIVDIKEGQNILSLNETTKRIEPARVKALLDMGIQPVFRLTTASGRKINTTTNHPYLTKEGWIEVSELREGMEIAVPNEKVLEKNQYSNNGLSLSFPVTGSTSYPKVSRTTTPSNTLSMISEIQILKGPSLPMSFIHASPLLIFTNPAPVLTCSSATGLISSSSAMFLGNTVKLAPVSINALSFLDLVFSKFDTSISTNVYPIQFTSNNDYNQEHINLSELDSNDIFWDTIASIEYLGEEHVYDVEIEGTHNFIGNEIFAHNTYTTASDSSGNNNTGTLTNMNTTGNATSGWTTGRFGKGMQFDGVDDYVTIADSDNWYFGSGDFAIDFWVKFNSLPPPGWNYQMFYSQYIDDNNYIEFSVYDSTAYGFEFEVKSGGSLVVSMQRGGLSLSTNTWYHMAVVRSGNTYYIFKDGTQVGDTLTDSDAIPDLAGQLYIGTYNATTFGFLNGTLDEFHIWNRSLSADEIKELYESSAPYFTQTNFTCSESTNQITPSLFRNETNVTATENGISTTLNIGYYYYLCNATATQNYTTSALLLPIRITCEPPASGNWTVPTNINCECNSTWTAQENLHVYGNLLMYSNCNIIFTPSGKNVYVYSGGNIYTYPGAGFNKPS